MPKIITYNNVKDFFEQNNCKLLITEEEYENVRTKLSFQCSCGNMSDIQYRSFKNTKKCKYCTNTKKYEYKDVKKYFEDNGCELLTTEENYINVKTKIEYLCNCKNKSEITFDNFKNGSYRCAHCSSNKTLIKKLTREDVSDIFNKRNCLLLTDNYKNNKQMLKYKCKCNIECDTTLKNFINLKNSCKHN
jgi:hypothetical protein